jgi:hypothetical protein
VVGLFDYDTDNDTDTDTDNDTDNDNDNDSVPGISVTTSVLIAPICKGNH